MNTRGELHSIPRLLAIIAGLVVLSGPSPAAERTVSVKFKTGAISSTIAGSLKGYDTVSYTLEARAGQVMSILFSPKNRACYFNVMAPGADTAVHIGSTTGNEYAANLTASGVYKAQVYLMRSAARRKETCKYSIVFEVSGARATTPAAAAPVKGAEELPMLQACAAAVTKMYGVTQDRIRYDAEGAVATTKSGFELPGQVDKGAEGRKKFKCLFGGDRALKDVMAMTPDGE